MKENQIITPENIQAFERSLQMLHTSIHELRKVAYNMIPESITRFGLSGALKDFCEGIQRAGTIRVAYQVNGVENVALNAERDIALYQIVLELVNNTYTHAMASQMVVQLTFQNNSLQLSVTDNGSGMDSDNVAGEKKGTGWQTIQSRITYLKGTVDVQSVPGKGTSVIITIPI